MSGKELLQMLKRSGGEVISEDQQAGLKYRGGKFLSLCPTCPGRVWIKVTDEYAEKVADILVQP